MMRSLVLLLLIVVAAPLLADEVDTKAIVEGHILPRYQLLAAETAELAQSASTDCSPQSDPLIASYHDAFDAWVDVSHLRFGPSEQDDRAFALAFWPDPRGSTPKALSALLQEQDVAVEHPKEFAKVSVAARGFYALEFLLFDPQFSDHENKAYHCALVQAVANDVSFNATAILDDWQNSYADLMANPGKEIYRTQTEAAQQLFTALTTGLEFTSQTRLGRPMGTFDRPRPNRAEARRSGRSLRHVVVSLQATRELASLISMGHTGVDEAFAAALQRAGDLDDPIFAGVAEPRRRLRVEVLQQNIDLIRNMLAEEVGPSLGITAGFNSLDGD